MLGTFVLIVGAAGVAIAAWVPWWGLASLAEAGQGGRRPRRRLP